MAQSYQDPNMGLLVVPGSYILAKIANTDSGVASNGVITLIGEAAMGLDYSNEESLEDNFFTPSDLGAVVAKYRSGPLGDGFRGAIKPSTDPDLPGSVSAVYLIKTNEGGTASKAILDSLSAAYATLFARSPGAAGSLIYFTNAETAEVKPTTSSFTYISPVGGLTQTFRVNGGAAVTGTITAAMTPTAYVAAVEALAGVTASGGADRLTIAAGRVSDASTLAVAATGNQVVVTISTGWSVTPTVGDTMIIPAGSAIVGAANANAGSYVVTAVSSTTITAIKLSDHNKPGAAAGTVTAPANVGAVDIASITADLVCYSPVTITGESSTIVNGTGKTLEINQTTAVEFVAYQLATTTPVTWLSVSGAPAVLVSASELSVTTTVSRQSDGVSDTFSAGGDIALKVGYTGTTASMVINSTTLTITVTGGSGANLGPLTLADYPTIADLVTYIGAHTGYVAAVGNTALGQQPPTVLDEGTYTCGSTYGSYTARVKMDGVAYYLAVRDNSSLVTLSDDSTPAASGLPKAYATNTFLAGGTAGTTTDATYEAALAAVEDLDCNFVVPLFCRDYTDDVADAITASGSTYTIANIHAATLDHCVAMSKPLVGKARQAFLSSRGGFQDARDVAAGLASHLVSLSFQDCKVSLGGIVQAKPWMTACKAAGAQSAAFYKGFFNKQMAVSGWVTSDASFNPNNLGQKTTALKSGLLVGFKAKDGGYKFLSDQTTYQKDNNSFYNSIQAIYAIHLVGATYKERTQRAIVGQSIADLSATQIAGIIKTISNDLLRVKLISPSDDAPSGYKNIVVKISGPVAQITLDVFVTTCIYFVPIVYNVNQITQTATL